MRRIVLVVSIFISALYAETPEFTPALLVEGELVQEFTDETEAGSIGLGKVEAGFELAVDNITGVINFELDEDAIALNEGFMQLDKEEKLSLKIGQFVNSFGSLETNGVSDPLIFDDVETKVPAVEGLVSNGTITAGVALYQGLLTEKFTSVVPSFAFGKEENFTVKVASRIEISDDVFADMAASAAVFLGNVTLSGELYAEFVEKSVEVDSISVSQKVLGFYGEAALAASEKLTISSRFDRRVDDFSADDLSGQNAIEAAAGYQFADPFCVHAGFQMVDAFTGDTHDWVPALTLMAAFEL